MRTYIEKERKNMKRFGWLALLLILAMTIAACGGGAQTETTVEEQPAATEEGAVEEEAPAEEAPQPRRPPARSGSLWSCPAASTTWPSARAYTTR
jgi:flagellar basal body-associated protein FliL